MENEEKLRISSDNQEILSVFYEAFSKEFVFQLYVNKDQPLNGKFVIVEEDLAIIEMIPEDIASLGNNKTVTFFIKNDHRSVLFKTQVLFQSNRLLMISLPKEVRLYDIRRYPRYYYCFDYFREVNLHLLKDGLDEFVFNFSCLNISPYGLAFVYLVQNDYPFDLGDKLQIVTLPDNHVPENFFAKIVHLDPFTHFALGTKKAMIVGVEFLRPLENLEYHPEIKKKIPNRLHRRYGPGPGELNFLIRKLTQKDTVLSREIHANVVEIKQHSLMAPALKNQLLSSFPIDILTQALRLSEDNVVENFLRGKDPLFQKQFELAFSRETTTQKIVAAQRQFIQKINEMVSN